MEEIVLCQAQILGALLQRMGDGRRSRLLRFRIGFLAQETEVTPEKRAGADGFSGRVSYAAPQKQARRVVHRCVVVVSKWRRFNVQGRSVLFSCNQNFSISSHTLQLHEIVS
jgi:hypothetical protein